MRNNEKFRQSKFSNWLHGSRLKFFDIRNFSSLITEKDWKISTFEIFQYIKFWSDSEQNFYDRIIFQDRIFSTFNRVIFSTVRISTEKFRQRCPQNSIPNLKKKSTSQIQCLKIPHLFFRHSKCFHLICQKVWNLFDIRKKLIGSCPNQLFEWTKWN